MFLRNRHHLGFRLLFILAAMALFVLGYQWGNQHQRARSEPSRISGVLIQPPGEIPDFELRDPFGRPFTRRDLVEGWTLLAFGDLAGASGQRAAQRLIDVRNRIADQPRLLDSLRLVLVQTGENAALGRDFARLSPALHLISGASTELAPLRDALGLASAVSPTLFVIGPGGQLLAVLPETEDGARMADDLKAIVANAPARLPETP